MDKQKKILVVIFAGFCLLQSFFIYKRVHNYPFMIYDMYSRKEVPKKYSEIYTVIADKDTLNWVKMPILQEGLLVNTLNIYDYHQQQHKDYWDHALSDRQKRLGRLFTQRSDRLLRNAKSNVDTYPMWLKNYLEDHVTQQPIHELKVYATTLDHAFGFNFKERIIIDVK